MQKTLAAPVRLEGVGLHLGRPVCVDMRPLPPGSGIIFVRKDLPARPRIKANVDNISCRRRRTVLVDGEAEVHTVEHLMAPLCALGVSNLEVCVDGPELPGLDGSALPFYKALKEVGTVEQDAPVPVIKLQAPIAVRDDGASLIAVDNEEGLKISYTLDYASPVISTQHLSVALTEETFAREIAPARTFCLEEEAKELQAAGLGKGASTQNTLVLGKEGVVDNELRFEDELVRHKILDLIGDLYLTSCRIQAEVLATKSGHSLNLQLAKSLAGTRNNPIGFGAEVGRREDGATMDAAPGEPLQSEAPHGYRGPLDVTMIESILPHRYPFLLVDRVVEVSEDGFFGLGIKNVTANEAFFRGHFPGNPVMPGVLQVESMAQLAGIVLLSHKQNAGRLAYLLSFDRVKFRRTVVPGDQLTLEVRVKNMKERSAQVEARATVDGSLATEALIRFVMVR